MIKLKSLFRRGQGGSPSATSSGSSKQTHQISPAHSVGIKSSASASSLDNIAVVTSGSSSADLGATRKLSKSHKQSSKDKLTDLLKVGSKEKLFDDKKELKKQQKKQMQQVAQQSTSLHPSPGDRETRPERSHSKDFDTMAFNGMQDVSSIYYGLRVVSRLRSIMGFCASVSLSIEPFLSTQIHSFPLQMQRLVGDNLLRWRFLRPLQRILQLICFSSAFNLFIFVSFLLFNFFTD